MRIEIFQSKDLEELVGIWNRNLHADLISSILLETRVLLDPNFREEFCLVAYDGGDMAGFILGICGDGFHFPGSLSGDRAWILATAVDARHRGKGVGSDLLRELERRFREAGKRSIWIASYPTAYIVPCIDEAAYAKGNSDVRIMIRHILPNSIAPMLVLGTLELAFMIIMEATLSFLGLGVQPPTPTWGLMCSEGREYLTIAWWLTTFSGLAIVFTVLGANLFGDWLRDTLDPRLKT